MSACPSKYLASKLINWSRFVWYLIIKQGLTTRSPFDRHQFNGDPKFYEDPVQFQKGFPTLRSWAG